MSTPGGKPLASQTGSCPPGATGPPNDLDTSLPEDATTPSRTHIESPAGPKLGSGRHLLADRLIDPSAQDSRKRGRAFARHGLQNLPRQVRIKPDSGSQLDPTSFHPQTRPSSDVPHYFSGFRTTPGRLRAASCPRKTQTNRTSGSEHRFA